MFAVRVELGMELSVWCLLSRKCTIQLLSL
jgi:hypothetical protein